MSRHRESNLGGYENLLVPLPEEAKMANPIKDKSDDVARAIDTAIQVCIRRIQVNMGIWHKLNSSFTYYQLRNLKDGDFDSTMNHAAEASRMHNETRSHGSKERYAYKAGVMGMKHVASDGLSHFGKAVPLLSVHTPSVALVSAGGVGAAIGPWVTAATIFWEYRGDINPQNLHDLIGNKSYGCKCGANNGSEPTDCDSIIRWIIDRKDYDLICTATSIFLFGVPSLVKGGYRFTRKQVKNVRWLPDGNAVYASPAPGASWNPDTDVCESCREPFKVSRFIGMKGQRHHCRLCGLCCCSKCCSFKGPVIDPLVPGEKNRQGGVIKKTKPSHERVCISCLAEMREQGQGTQRYQTGPNRMARYLVDNAMPNRKSLAGCNRAAAAIYVLARGDVKKMLASLVATDGHTAIVRWAKM